MTQPDSIDDLPAALAARSHPTVGLWNRLEGRPRTTDFDGALRAEVRDPLWMLTRQWQVGEFRGSDGGSPITATYSVSVATPGRFRPGAAAVEALPPDRPLESVVERRRLPLGTDDRPVALDLRLIIGRRWLKLLANLALLGLIGDYRPAYIAAYPLAVPPEPDPARVAHPGVRATLDAVAGRRMDGYRLYRRMKAGHPASEDISVLFLHVNAVNQLGDRLVAWFDDLIDQPAGEPAWDSRRLAHRCSVAAATPTGGRRVLTASEHPGGTLDWHTFSPDTATVDGAVPEPVTVTRTVFPTPVRYAGMPLPRWWAIEDGQVNLAAVRADTTDVARLVMLEFALIFGNDWVQIPCDLPTGTLATVRGLVVTDVFGQRRWIAPAGADDPADRRRWGMFDVGNGAPDDRTLFLPASAPKVAEGPPLEAVALARDENANVVWGVERTVQLATGDARRGGEVAATELAYLQARQPPPQAGEPRAALVYRAMNSVPENWIPFVPIHVPGDVRNVVLRRSAMPSAVDGTAVAPRTSLLTDSGPAHGPFLINEEEVPQAGTTLTLAHNRARWHDGRVVVWLAARRGSGRGETSSGIAFDLAAPAR